MTARRHCGIATLAPVELVEAVNQAYAGGETTIALFVHLSRQIQSKNLIPGLPSSPEASQPPGRSPPGDWIRRAQKPSVNSRL